MTTDIPASKSVAAGSYTVTVTDAIGISVISDACAVTVTATP